MLRRATAISESQRYKTAEVSSEVKKIDIENQFSWTDGAAVPK